VADAVGDLPLAVEQAGSLLADTGLTVDKYLRLLAERAQDVLYHDPGGAYPASLAASCAVAFDRLVADDPTALDLLTLVAWCGPEPVPLTLLTDHPAALPDQLRPLATDPLLLARCTTILHRRGMAAVSRHAIQLHRIPAALLRARSQASEGVAAAGWAATVARLLEKAARSGRVAPVERVTVVCATRGWPRCRPRRGSGRGNRTARSRRGLPVQPRRGSGRLGDEQTCLRGAAG
jgi:hypothetical protein